MADAVLWRFDFRGIAATINLLNKKSPPLKGEKLPERGGLPGDNRHLADYEKVLWVVTNTDNYHLYGYSIWNRNEVFVFTA